MIKDAKQFIDNCLIPIDPCKDVKVTYTREDLQFVDVLEVEIKTYIILKYTDNFNVVSIL